MRSFRTKQQQTETAQSNNATQGNSSARASPAPSSHGNIFDLARGTLPPELYEELQRINGHSLSEDEDEAEDENYIEGAHLFLRDGKLWFGLYGSLTLKKALVLAGAAAGAIHLF